MTDSLVTAARRVVHDFYGTRPPHIGPFEQRDAAQAEAHHWRQPNVRAMVRYLWDGEVLRRELEETATQRDQGTATP